MPKTKHLEYGEPKKVTTMTLTQEAIQELDRQAGELGISRSELVETFARNKSSQEVLAGRFLGE
ncbi:MAG TPA: hypothetical protein DCY88_18280 [Cyanobacteria bacterium UBA11372]|nr:hypothetical protein [Cyanobacteria bacterium UBA11372]